MIPLPNKKPHSSSREKWGLNVVHLSFSKKMNRKKPVCKLRYQRQISIFSSSSRIKKMRQPGLGQDRSANTWFPDSALMAQSLHTHPAHLFQKFIGHGDHKSLLWARLNTTEAAHTFFGVYLGVGLHEDGP